MGISERLRRLRKIMKISQQQMCEGVITEAYYSRVENSLDNVSMVDLIRMLNNNSISLADFFEDLDLVKDDSEIKRDEFPPADTLGQRLKQTRQILNGGGKSALYGCWGY